MVPEDERAQAPDREPARTAPAFAGRAMDGRIEGIGSRAGQARCIDVLRLSSAGSASRSRPSSHVLDAIWCGKVDHLIIGWRAWRSYAVLGRARCRCRQVVVRAMTSPIRANAIRSMPRQHAGSSIHVADRVLVMRNGRIAATLEGDHISEEEILRAAMLETRAA